MKNIKILVVFFIIVCNFVHAQPIFRNPINGNLVDGFFINDCNPNGDCNNYVDASCANWMTVTVDQPLLIFKYSCLGMQQQNLSGSEENFCLLKYFDNGIQEIDTGISQLIIGQTYRISFYQMMLGNVTLREIYRGCVDGSTANFKIFIEGINGGVITFPSTDMICDKRNGGPLPVYQSFTFIATQESQFMKILPNHISGNIDFTLGISSIRIECISEDCLSDSDPNDGDPYNPTDEVTVTQPCSDCTSFELINNEYYNISAWVKRTDQNDNDIRVSTYNNNSLLDNNSFIEVLFTSAIPNQSFTFFPSGEIIDGWQRVMGKFKVPQDGTELFIKLHNLTDDNAYFDDIRIHPFNSNLKSFVYDQESQKLMAELDENNYATFYEYDKEGGLIRIKKETEKGVFTIQETRSSSIKN